MVLVFGLGLWSWSPRVDAEADGGADALRALDGHFAADSVDELLADEETDAGTGFAAHALRGSGHIIENLLELLLPYAHTVVDHSHPEAVASGLRFDADFTIRIRELDGVTQQILQHHTHHIDVVVG